MASQLFVSRIVPVIAHAVAVFGDEHKGIALACHTITPVQQSPAIRPARIGRGN
jgi:hypothetical protein